MNRTRSILAAACLASAAALPGMAHATNSIELVYNGLAIPNGSQAPATAAFVSWCNGECFPTTQFPVFDASTGRKRGDAYVWGKSFAYGAAGASLCFSEFIAFTLDQGNLHVNSPANGTCGAGIDPSLKPPKHTDLGALMVIAGGGDGVINGGTGKFRNWTGTYTDRVFVGFGAPTSGVGGIIYYDQLWFSISGK